MATQRFGNTIVAGAELVLVLDFLGKTPGLSTECATAGNDLEGAILPRWAA